MNRTFQKTVCIALASVVLMLASCNQGKIEKDIDAAKIATQLSQVTPTESKWIDDDQDFIQEYVTFSEYIKESQIFYAQNTNDLDEFGVFEVEEGKAQEVRTRLMKGYLKKRYDENLDWYNSYMPTETPKLRDAEVRIYGNCVVYAVLSADRRIAFFAECEKLLKEKK